MSPHIGDRVYDTLAGHPATVVAITGANADGNYTHLVLVDDDVEGGLRYADEVQPITA